MLTRIILGLIRFYRFFLSPLSLPACRFDPTCSAYALEAVERDARWSQADVVMITDGRCRVSGEFAQEWGAARERLRFTCYAIRIGADAGHGLEAVADPVVVLDDLADEAGAVDLVLSA